MKDEPGAMLSAASMSFVMPDAHKLYLEFRGKEPSPAGLIKKRGL